MFCFFSYLIYEIKEIDEDEFDQRRAVCLADMKDLEAQFAKLKEELINERNLLVDKKLKEIEEETADEFVIPLKKLQMSMDFKINFTSKLINLFIFIYRKK